MQERKIQSEGFLVRKEPKTGALSPLLYTMLKYDIIKKCKRRLRKAVVEYRYLIKTEILDRVLTDDLIILAENDKSLKRNENV